MSGFFKANLTREFNELEARANVNGPKSHSTYSSGEDSDDEDTSATRSSRRHGARPINGVAYEEFTVSEVHMTPPVKTKLFERRFARVQYPYTHTI